MFTKMNNRLAIYLCGLSFTLLSHAQDDLSKLTDAQKRGLCLQGLAYEGRELNPPLYLCAAIAAAKASGGPDHGQRLKIERYFKKVFKGKKINAQDANTIQLEYRRRMSPTESITWLAKQAQSPMQARDAYTVAASVVAASQTAEHLKKGKAYLKELAKGLGIEGYAPAINDQVLEPGAE